jgi:hypothetical protein
VVELKTKGRCRQVSLAPEFRLSRRLLQPFDPDQLVKVGGGVIEAIRLPYADQDTACMDQLVADTTALSLPGMVATISVPIYLPQVIVWCCSQCQIRPDSVPKVA